MTEKGTENIHVEGTALKFTLYYCSHGFRFPPLFAQTHHRADSAAYPWKEEASGMEPPELRHRHVTLQLLLTTLPPPFPLLFRFSFNSFKQTSPFRGQTIRKNSSQIYSKRNCSINWFKHLILTHPSIHPARQWAERTKEQKQPHPEKKDWKAMSIHPLRSPKGLMRNGICEAEAKNRWSGFVTDKFQM